MDKELYALGIDIGGTNTELAVVSDKGTIISRESLPTASAHEFGAFAAQLAGVAECLIDSCPGLEVSCAGVGAPAINARTGWIDAATDLPWPTPADVCGELSSLLSIPVTAVNDANAAAAGERLAGAAKGMDNFIELTLGTGVGTGVVCNGELLTGSRGFAGELGHMTIPFGEGRVCSCGRTDCLQTYASASGVILTAKKLAAESVLSSKLIEVPEKFWTPRLVEDYALKRDALALETWRRTGRWLGIACANFAAATDPDAIIFFGGVARAFPLFAQSLEAAFKRYSLHLNRDHVRFIHSSLPTADAAVLGAAATAFQSL